MAIWMIIYFLAPLCLGLDNIALNKPANQTGVYGRYVASRAVDGDHVSHRGLTCAHPDAGDGNPAQWWVDLQDTYRVYNVTVYNTESSGYYRLTQFIISVSNSSTEEADCGGVYTDVVPAGGQVTIQCGHVGRYVHFRRVGPPEKQYVTLCEVEVFGHLYIDCSVCDGSCGEVSGCNQCPAGKQRPACLSACEDGYYGINCDTPCGSGCPRGQCGKITGQCQENCTRWWAGEKCDVSIEPAYYNNENERIAAVTNSSVQIAWQQLSSIPIVAAVYYGYQIEYRREDLNQFQLSSRKPHSNSTEMNYALVTGLHYNTEYVLRVTPYRHWMGESSELGTSYPEISAKTKCSEPNEPQEPIVSHVCVQGKGTAVDVRIPNLILVDSQCDSYSQITIEYRLVQSEEWTTVVVAPEIRSQSITLPGGGIYDFRLTIMNNEQLTSSSPVVRHDFGDSMMSVMTDKPGYIIPWILFGVSLLANLILVVVFVVVYKRMKDQIRTAERKGQVNHDNQGQTMSLSHEKTVAAPVSHEGIQNQVYPNSEYEELDVQI